MCILSMLTKFTHSHYFALMETKVSTLSFKVLVICLKPNKPFIMSYAFGRKSDAVSDCSIIPLRMLMQSCI